jgi:hypothetical protein
MSGIRRFILTVKEEPGFDEAAVDIHMDNAGGTGIATLIIPHGTIMSKLRFPQVDSDRRQLIQDPDLTLEAEHAVIILHHDYRYH